MGETKILCDRCGEWHERVVKVWNNMECRYKHECLSCLAEMLIGRGRHGDSLVGSHGIARVAKVMLRMWHSDG